MAAEVGGAVGHFFHCLWFFFYSVVLNAAQCLLPSSMLPKKNVAGKVVLITGAGSGIGRLLAHRFARLGSRLVLWDVNEKGNNETAETCREIGAEVSTWNFDISDRDEVYAAANEVKDTVGEVDVLVNNAGILFGKLFLQTEDAKMSKLFDVNVKAHFWTLKAFLPSMVERNDGHVVSVCSLAGFVGAAGLVDYATSKFAAVGLMESISNELAVMGKTGIKTTIVCPTFIQTPMIAHMNLPKRHGPLEPDHVADKIVEATLLNRRWLMMPKKMYWLYYAKGWLPANVFNSIIIHKLIYPQ